MVSNKSKIINATKWSFLSEFMAKMIVPVTNMILARILAPEIFGVVATVNMVVSFTDMFTTAGFQKYLVQHEYESREQLYKGTSVAFWTNLALSVFLWGAVTVFRDPIAFIVGSKGYGAAIAVACLSLPLTSFSSIQEALFRRSLDFRVLFFNRIIAILIPFVVTIPLALLGFGYWSLIIGTLCGHLAKAVVLTCRSKWKPNGFFSFSLLKKMLSFSLWTLTESFSVWAASWVDVIIISNVLSDYHLGLYKTSMTTIAGILALITNTTTSVLFSSLSRAQNDFKEFCNIFYRFQRIVAVFVFPMGVGVYIFRDFITYVLLGPKWAEASIMIGAWGISASLVCVYGSFSREAYQALGKPKISLITQILHIICIVPVCYIGVMNGYNTLVWARSLVSLQIILVHFIFLRLYIHIPIKKIIGNTVAPLVCSVFMGLLAFKLRSLSDSYLMNFIFIFISALFYFACLFCIPSFRKEILSFKDAGKNQYKRFYKNNSGM